MKHATVEILHVLVFLQIITAVCNYTSDEQNRIFEALSFGYTSHLRIPILYSRISIKRRPPAPRPPHPHEEKRSRESFVSYRSETLTFMQRLPSTVVLQSRNKHYLFRLQSCYSISDTTFCFNILRVVFTFCFNVIQTFH